MPPQLLAMVAVEQGGTRRFLRSFQDRRLHGCVHPHQQLDVVGLAIELSELAAPTFEKGTGGARFVELLRRRRRTFVTGPRGRRMVDAVKELVWCVHCRSEPSAARMDRKVTYRLCPTPRQHGDERDLATPPAAVQRCEPGPSACPSTSSRAHRSSPLGREVRGSERPERTGDVSTRSSKHSDLRLRVNESKRASTGRRTGNSLEMASMAKRPIARKAL